MRSVVLLSGGVDPVSGRPSPPETEVAAIGLAMSLDGLVTGLHAGARSEALRQAAGYGLEQIVCLAGKGDAVARLATCLSADPPDIVLAGQQASGDEDSGMLPYLLAERLGWPLLSGVIAIGAVEEGWLSVTLGLPQGARQQASLRLPCILCAQAGVAPPPFVFDRARRAVMRDIVQDSVGEGADAVDASGAEAVDRPYRARPRLVAATTQAGGAGRVLTAPDSDEAARALRDHLRGLGLPEIQKGSTSHA